MNVGANNNLNSASSKRTITSAWAYCSSVYNMRVKDLKAYHIKGCMNDGTIVKKGKRQNTSPNTKSRIKSLFNLMLDYANEHDLVDKNYARTFDLSGDIIKDLENTRVPHIHLLMMKYRNYGIICINFLMSMSLLYRCTQAGDLRNSD